MPHIFSFAFVPMSHISRHSRLRVAEPGFLGAAGVGSYCFSFSTVKLNIFTGT